MRSAPIRWVCGSCLNVERHSLEIFNYCAKDSIANAAVTRVYLPQCCGRDMLIAGEPKRDVHGLREKDAMIDPVDNLKLMVVT